MVACVQVPVRKFRERLPTAWPDLSKLFLLPSSVCALSFLSLSRHQSTTDVDPEGVCGGPLFAPPFTSARVQRRLEFVELGGDICSTYHIEPLFLCMYS